MARTELIAYGKIVSAADILTGESYTDFRNDFIDIRGYVVVYKSPRRTPNNHFAFFIPINSELDRYLETSQGYLTREGNTLTLENKHSRYIFELEDTEITDEKKKSIEAMSFS